MNIRGMVIGAGVALALVGCQSVPFIDQAQPAAINAATRRAQFEFNCPAALGQQVISREEIQEPMGYMRWMPPERAEYTIGVSGCGRRATYLVLCTDGGGCIAGGGREETGGGMGN